VASRGKKELLEVECKPTKPSGDPLQASGKRGGAEVIGSSDRSDASIKALTWFYGPRRSLVLPIGVVISGFVASRRINTPLSGTIPVHYTLAVLVKERSLGPVCYIGPYGCCRWKCRATDDVVVAGGPDRPIRVCG